MATDPTLLTVACVQMRLDRALPRNLDHCRQFLRRAGQQGVDLVVFPECALTSYDMDYIACLPRAEIENSIDAVKKEVRRAGCTAVLGTPTYDLEGRRNSALVISPEGKAVALYHKVQLVGQEPEVFIPGNRIGYFEIGGSEATGEVGDLIGGSEATGEVGESKRSETYPTEQYAAGVFICHDGRYPELARIPVMMGARLLCHLSAGVDSVTALAWKGLVRSRGAHSAQTDVFYLLANAVGAARDGRRRTRGQSTILHPTGLPLVQADDREEVLLTTRIDLSEAQARWARRSLEQLAFLSEHWQRILEDAHRSIRPGQLKMIRRDLKRLPRPRTARGYRLRTYRAGDEADWARLVKASIGGNWDAKSAHSNLTGQERFFPDGLFFAETAQGKVVGTACAWRRSADGWEEGELHMVAVDEEHRGHGLGRALSVAVLRYFREKGFKRVRLSTDDFRVPALAIYLDLKFDPITVDELHRQRWQDLRALLRKRR